MTSPFMLATRKKKEVVEPQNAPPSQAMYGQRVEPADLDPRTNWQTTRDKLINTDRVNSEQQIIAPVASSIPVSTYTDRFAPIRSIGETAAYGQVQSSEIQRQMAAQRAANQLAQMQSDALGNAYAASANVDMNGMPIQDGGGGGGWGSGGAQGVANVLRAAGFPEELVPTFMAIAKAESGWRPDALNTSNRNGSTDAGLFQINSVHKGNSWYPTNLNDPMQSARAALAIYKQQGLKAWSVYNSGAYRQFMQAAPPKQVTATPTLSGGVMSTGNGSLRNAVVQKSLVVLNLPYVWGGNSLQTGVDCSGLVQQVYKQVLGKNTPRTAAEQARNGAVGSRVANVSQLRPGDLVAFQWAGGWRGAGAPSHIAIYAGNGEIIEAYGGSNGRRRKLGNSAQDRGAIYISVKFPGE